jgi:hypothetical protein
MIYIASAYTRDPDRSVALHRRYGQHLIAQGLMCYSPVVHGHFLQRNADYEYWVQHGLEMLNLCDRLHVVETAHLPYDGSRGVAMEITLAAANGIETSYYNCDNLGGEMLPCDPSQWAREAIAAGLAARKGR